jgi:hypothetical protein
MKAPDPFCHSCVSKLLALVFVCVASSFDAGEPKTIKNPDGSTTKVEEVDFGQPRKAGEAGGITPIQEDVPFYGKGEKRTTEDKDGNVIKVEWLQKNKLRRVVFFKDEKGVKVVTRYDYAADGKTVEVKSEKVFSRLDGRLLSQEDEKYKSSGQLDKGSKRFREGQWYDWDPKTESWEKSAGPPGRPETLEDVRKQYDVREQEKPREISSLLSQGQVQIETVGTGQTIGHIVDFKFRNLTNQPLNFVMGPMVLESTSGKSQDYVCPKGQTVALDPRGAATVPVNGVCINRHKPPVGKGEPGDLIVNTGDPNVPQNPDSHIPAAQALDLLRICSAKYRAADKLQEEGAFTSLPYKDKQRQIEIVVQWATWTDPQICEIVGTTPATKDDLKKVVYKQVEEKGPMSPDTKKKVDQGIDTIFEKVELTSAKAKDLAKPDDQQNAPDEGSTVEETPPVGEPEYVGQTQAKKPTPTPTPKKGGGTKSKPTPTPKKEEPKKGGTTEEKPKEPPANPPTTEKPVVPVAPDKNAKPKEAVVVVQVNGDPTNKDMLRSANALKNRLDDAGQDAQRVVMGNIGGADIQSVDELERYLKNKVMKGTCLHSIHILGHGRKNESSGNYVFDFPPRAGKEDEEDMLWVQEEDARPARPDERPIKHAEFGKENFAKIFKNVVCPDGEVFLEECYTAAGKDSLAQYVANQTGLKVHGHTTTVLFPLDMAPRPGETDQPTTTLPKK